MSKYTNMTEDDLDDLCLSLSNWFTSKDVPVAWRIIACAEMAALLTLVGKIRSSDKDLRHGIDLFCRMFTNRCIQMKRTVRPL